MKPRIIPVDIPPSCRLAADVEGSYFHDAFEIELDTTGRSAMSLYLAAASLTPKWVDALMSVRNRMVSLVGLKNLGTLSALDPHKPASAYKVGERVGIFTLLHVSDDEVVLGDADKHLHVKVSVCRVTQGVRQTVVVSNVVCVHNTLGKVYMFFVEPIHKRITPAMMAHFPQAASAA